MRVLGIDPGSSATGFGVIERVRGAPGVVHVAHGTLRAPRGMPLAQRLAQLHADLVRTLAEHRPEVVVVERVFAGRSVRAALVLGQARGVALAAAAAAGVPVEEYTPPEIKLAVVGTGAAEKRQVQAMVARLLGLASLPPSDAADALAAALCHAHCGPLGRRRAAAAGARRGRVRRAAAARLVVRRAP